MILWPVALILLNSLWLGISNNSAPYEINDYDHPIEERIITLGGVLGQDKPMPAVFDVEFQSLTDGGGSVEWNIFDENDVLIAQWSGDVSDENPGWEGELTPGTYRFQTVSEQESLPSKRCSLSPLVPMFLRATSLYLHCSSLSHLRKHSCAKKAESTLKKRMLRTLLLKRKHLFHIPAPVSYTHLTLPTTD